LKTAFGKITFQGYNPCGSGHTLSQYCVFNSPETTLQPTDTMDKPDIADTKPAVLELEPGAYWWCSCGKSATQPFCDGAHKGGSFSPVKIEITEKKTVALCNCKHSKNGAFCDGSHSTL
jgi:CDGSH-type Zn-finger protein